GSDTATSSLSLNVSSLKLTTPPFVTVFENASLTFSSANQNLISVADANTSATIQITLSASNGTLTLSGTSGVSFSSGSNSSAAMSFSGILADVNAALNGLVYTPTANSLL